VGRRHRTLLVSAVLAAAIAPVALSTAAKPHPKTVRVSVSSGGAQGDGSADTYDLSISNSGRYVAFGSSATNLTAGDGNANEDVFIHDRKTQKTTLASVNSHGHKGNGDSDYPAISASGRYIAFDSSSSNLVAHDTNAEYDVFERDLKTGKTRMVSVSSGGKQCNSTCGDYGPTVSANGRFVAFDADASSLVHQDSNGSNDIFLRDLKSGRTKRVSVSSSGAQADGGSNKPVMSANGRFIAFESSATNLVHHDTNASVDVFVHDVKTGKTRRVSVASNGHEAGAESRFPTISADGRYIAFQSEASNLVGGDSNASRDIFVHDLKTGKTKLISVTPSGAESSGDSSQPTISPDGHFVSFDSAAEDLTRNDHNHQDDVFLRDLKAGKTKLMSVSTGGAFGHDDSDFSRVSAGGRFVAFGSSATTLVGGDTNGDDDVFERGPLR
jgi:Tol biopolymer transport system component